jgi:hypothetical protein
MPVGSKKSFLFSYAGGPFGKKIKKKPQQPGANRIYSWGLRCGRVPTTGRLLAGSESVGSLLVHTHSS